MDDYKDLEDDVDEGEVGSEFSKNDEMLWKRRYETACEFVKESDQEERSKNVIKYLHNDFSFVPESDEVFLNHFSISLKTLVALSIANNPDVSVEPENDVVYEYDENGLPLKDQNGEVIQHDIVEFSKTVSGLLKKNLTNPNAKVMDLKKELRIFLRDSIAFNRGIFLVGHTINSGYNGSFNKQIFHPYIKAINPRRIKRQPGTTRIEEGTYCFYEYELPFSFLKKDISYDQEVLQQCTKCVLEGIRAKMDEEESEKGYFDDVKYIQLHNAYDLLTGKIYIFGSGCDKPLKVVDPGYSFTNPFEEFIPNEIFQPEQREPVSDLMMVEKIVQKTQSILKKIIEHIENFNAGYNVEESAIDRAQRGRIEKSKKVRSFWVFKDNAISGGKVMQRNDVQLGNEPFNLLQFLFDYIEKTLAVYNFQQGGGSAQEDETATKTQAKVQTSQFKTGQMAGMFAGEVNKALTKYVEVMVRSTTTPEVVKCIGDAGEVEYKPFNKNEAEKGQYYCKIDIQSMGEIDDVRNQQALKFYELLKADPDPAIQMKFDKVKLVTKIAEFLKMGKDGIIKKDPDTQGLSQEDFKTFMKSQLLKAKKENEQAMQGANILPPSPDDDDDLHLEEHLPEANKVKQQIMANPALQNQLQPIIDRIVGHAQMHLEAKRTQEILEGAEQSAPQAPVSQPSNVVSMNPQMSGDIAGQAVKTGGFR